MVGFELGARWFEARGLLEWGESAYQPIQKLTGPKLADTRVSIQNTRYQRKTRRFLIEQSACVRSEVDPIIRTTGGPALDSGRRSFSTPWAIDFPRCLIT